MKMMTTKNLEDAFAGESQAHMKYMIFADQAEREGLANIARLFRAASYSEQMHATAHLRALGGVNATSKNLEGALGGENFEIAEMYPAYIATAKEQQEKGAIATMERALAAEKVHSVLYARAKESAEAKKDLDLSAIFVCEVCGFTVDGAAPEKCPVCGASQARFRRF
jgi:rubrerythrin